LQEDRVKTDPEEKVLFVNTDGVQQFGKKMQVDGRHAQVLCR
jgi:tetrahydromethanopterin S-methyltransferase subunit G